MSTALTRAEAAKVLEIDPNATEEDIRAAYKVENRAFGLSCGV